MREGFERIVSHHANYNEALPVRDRRWHVRTGQGTVPRGEGQAGRERRWREGKGLRRGGARRRRRRGGWPWVEAEKTSGSKKEAGKRPSPICSTAAPSCSS